MKTASDILQLGDPLLYEVCEPLVESDLSDIKQWVSDMHNVIIDVRAQYNFGRAIAAPQLGIMKRLVYMFVNEPHIFINPTIRGSNTPSATRFLKSKILSRAPGPRMKSIFLSALEKLLALPV